MGNGNEMPTIKFLMQPENLPDVLQIVQYAEQIRERVENDFWEDFEKRLREQKPADLPIEPIWRQEHGFDEQGKRGKRGIYSLPSFYYPALECFVQPVSENTQGIKYRIEFEWDYLGHGLYWMRTDDPNWKTMCQTKAIRRIQEVLKGRQGDIESKMSSTWLWWEYWERDPYKDVAETWTWYAKKRADDSWDSWCSGKAQSFWEFVKQTYELVIQANEELRQLKG